MNGTCIKIEETEIRTVLVGGGGCPGNNHINSNSSNNNICNRNGASSSDMEILENVVTSQQSNNQQIQIIPQPIQSSKIILSPRVEFRHVINKNPDLEIIETTATSMSITPPQQQQQQVIISAAPLHEPPIAPPPVPQLSQHDNNYDNQQNRSSQVRVIKDGRFYEEPVAHRTSYIVNSTNHQNTINSNGINRQVNVITSDRLVGETLVQQNNHNNNNSNNVIFRPPVVSSTSQPMRPPPPPPPPKLKGCTPSEEPSSSIPDLEFDGTTVLCRVCGDKASGFHYGVHSCEGCKGFFRRSIQQKIQYRPCTKNQQCCILRINRNRCQYCRLKKCISVGMSRDAVRFGRVPKREKARILAAMQQSTQNRGQQRQLATELDDQPRLLSAVLRAHMETCEFTRDKVTAMRQRARECPTYSMPTLACPLNPAPELQSEQEFSQRFAHVIRGVIDFAGMIPGFQFLTQDDKFTLLKAGLFDALFVRLICMFDSDISSIICLNGQVMRRDAIQNGANARFLVDSTFNFAERINSMNLTDAEIGLFCAIVLITPDRPGLRNLDLIEKMYSRLKTCLQSVIMQNRPDQPEFMGELMKTLPDLRTLSTLHTEKLVVFRTEHKELLRQQMWSLDEESSKSPHSAWGCSGDNIIEDVAKSPMGSVSSTESSDTISSDYSHSLTSSAPLLAASLSGGCPLRHRASSGSSAEDDIGHLTQNGLTITPVVRAVPPQHHIRYRKLDSPTDSGIESGNEKPDHKPAPSSGSSSCSSPRSSVEDVTEEKKFHVEDMPVLKRVLQAPPLYDTNSLMDEAYKPHKKFRAMRQRESDAEPESSNSINNNNLNNSSSNSNLINNSSNNNHNNNNNVSNTNSTHHLTTTTITAHPIHHHVIQQTSSTTNTTLGSSPQHHLQVNNPSSNLSQSQQQQQQQQHHQHTLHPQQSQLHMHLTRPQHQTNASSSLLSSTHSVLAKSLMEEPRMTPEQMKRSDIIQNYIMRESQQDNGGYRSPHPSSSSSSSSSSPHPHIPSSAATNQHQGLLVVSGRWQPSSGPTSVITTTRNHSPSPNTLNDNTSTSRYYQSPHSTSSSSASSSPPQSIKSPRLLELQVDIADTQQPLNLSKKSPTPPRSLHKIKLEA